MGDFNLRKMAPSFPLKLAALIFTTNLLVEKLIDRAEEGRANEPSFACRASWRHHGG